MALHPKRYVRQMPQIYGNLQPNPKPTLRWLVWASKLCIVFGIAGYCLYVIFFSPTFQVRSVTVSGATFSSVSAAQAAIPRGNNIWLLSSATVRNRILQDPSVTSVELWRGLPHTVHITLTERPISVLWQTGQTVALVDQSGRVFKLLPASDLSVRPLSLLTTQLPVITDAKNLAVQPGAQLLSPQFITFVSQVAVAINKTVPTLHVDHFSVADSTYTVTLYTKEGPLIQLSVVSDPNVQLRNVQRLVSQVKPPADSQIDVRVNRWAYIHE